MLPFYKEDVVNIYGQLLSSAHRNADYGKWLNAIVDLESAATWAYAFNWTYADEDADSLIKTIAERAVPQVKVTCPQKNRCVFLDSFCLDNRGLTQQYLRAMIQSRMEVLYVCTSTSLDNGKDIIKEIRDYPKADLLVVENSDCNRTELISQIICSIDTYSPSSVFLHIAPWDIVALMVSCSVKGPIVYNINLTDHAFWLGASFIDYNFEFRPYGMTVSLEKRGLKKAQLLPLPFCALKPLASEFVGFPPLPETAVKIFTGGALYKVLGKHDVFFHIMECLLAISPNVYILVAGFDFNEKFAEKCDRLVNGNHIIQIGIRKDIDAVFDNIDIFLSTYPISGGLMTQYAAIHSKPILAYREEGDSENAIEELLNHFQNSFHSFTNLDEMYNYAKKLIFDGNYRTKEGKILREGMMTPERFNFFFSKTIESGLPQWEWGADMINYEAFFNHYLELENENGFTAFKHLVEVQKFSLLIKLHGFKVKVVWGLMHMLRRSISLRGEKFISYLCGR